MGERADAARNPAHYQRPAVRPWPRRRFTKSRAIRDRSNFKIAGAQADYAIAIAVAQASSLVAADDGSGQAEFAARYAQGYVQWLSDLKPTFVANATATAQAAAQNEEDTLAADVNLADEQSDEDAQALDTEEPQSEQESGTMEQEGDDYSDSTVTNTGNDQIGTAEADQTQMLDLADAAKVYLIACAQADKDRAVHGSTNVTNTQQIYTDEIAQAKLTLTDSQADADLAWIKGKALADEDFSKADATAWQTMSDSQAATSEQFALEDDGDVQSESDVLALDQADQMTAYALADQKQGNSDASAEASFEIAQATETATIWSEIVGWASPTSGNPAGLPGLPWMQSQAGLASAESTWAVTSAANYQGYVAQLGTAEITYANTNAADFVNELKTIDGLDKTAADGAASADEQLTISLTDDEAAFEQTLAPASEGFQIDVAQAQHDDRQAIALADYNLAVAQPSSGVSEAAYEAALAAAASAEQNGYNQAYANFATPMMPAMTTQGISDAAAEFLDRETTDDENLADISQNNQAVDDYQNEESTLYSSEQQSDALALFNEQVSDAVGHASAIATFASVGNALCGVPNPWVDFAAAQAATDAIFQIAGAAATLTRSASEAQAQSTQEQADNNALEARSVSEAQTEHDQDESQASADEASADAQAAAADAVFQNLPDTLIAPADGPVLALLPDFTFGYDANDFYLGPTTATFGQEVGAFTPGQEIYGGGADLHAA